MTPLHDYLLAYSTVATLVIVLLLMASYSLSIEYAKYKESAEVHFDDLDFRIAKAEQDLKTMTSTCAAYLDQSYPDTGNDFSN